MNSEDIQKRDDTIIIPDNMPVGAARPVQLGDTREFGTPEPEDRIPLDYGDRDVEQRAPAPLDEAQQPVIEDEASVGDVIPVTVHTDTGSEPAEVLATGESGEPILTDPPRVGDAGGDPAQTLPGGNTNQGFVATGSNVGTEAGQPAQDTTQEPETLEPLDTPPGPEAVDSPVDTTRTLGAVSADGKWYARSNDGETRAFDSESDRDAYVANQQGWSAFVNA